MSDKQYEERDVMALDEAGGYYFRHVSAMTGEKLFAKSDIAAELGHRDMVIDQLQAEIQRLRSAMQYACCGSKDCIGMTREMTSATEYECDQCREFKELLRQPPQEPK